MKIAKLLPDRMTRFVLLLLPCLVLFSACGGGAGEGINKTQAAQLQEVVDRLGAIQVQLEQNRHHAHRHVPLSKEQLREVFQPLGEVLAQVVDQQQRDRQQWVAMIADVRRLSQVVEVGVAQKERSELQAMRGRLDQIDKQLREQDQRSREAKAALIQALDAAGSRLDGLLKELDAPPPPAKEEDKTGAGKGAGKGEEKDKTQASGEHQAEGAGTAFLITFLAISVVLLVGWVVFFPNRVRSVVPRVHYTARPEMAGAAAEQEQEPGRESASRGAPELDHVEAQEVVVEAPTAAAVAAATTVAKADGPEAVHLEVPCGDPETAAERVSGYLAAEPRVLLHPAPDLEARKDTLAMRFYLVPAVPEQQQSRIKAAIRGLAEESTPAATAAGTASRTKDKDNDLPAA